MSLREEMERYEKLTGESAEHTPIMKIGAYLDGYERGLAELKPMQVELEADGYADGELVYDYGKCPKCGWEFEIDDKDWEEHYCCHCGQKLKWFESDGGNIYED